MDSVKLNINDQTINQSSRSISPNLSPNYVPPRYRVGRMGSVPAQRPYSGDGMHEVIVDDKHDGQSMILILNAANSGRPRIPRFVVLALKGEAVVVDKCKQLAPSEILNRIEALELARWLNKQGG